MRAELAAAHAALSRVVEALDDHLYTLQVDDDGSYRAVYRGPNRDALFGGPLPSGDGDDRLWDALLHPDDRDRFAAAAARLRDGQPLELEYRLVGLDGRERVMWDRLRPRRDADGTLYFDGLTRDITERRRLEGELRRSMAEMQHAHRELEAARADAELRARTDALTGAYNRRHFAEIVAEALAGEPAECGLLLLDVDHFKQVNDAYGHGAGDAVLVELARRLGACLGPADALGRWGGEEFAVLLRGVGADADLAARAERFRAAVAAAPVVVDGLHLQLTVSIGAVRAGTRADVDHVVEAADRCLYGAKREGRNRVSLVSHVEAADAAAREPEVLGMARALAFAAAVREGAPEAHAEVAALAARTAERLALPVGAVLRCRLGGCCTTSARSRSRSTSSSSPGGSTRRSGRSCARTRSSARRSSGGCRRCARRRLRCATTTSATTAPATPTASRARPSRSRPASSPPPTRTPRSPPNARTPRHGRRRRRSRSCGEAPVGTSTRSWSRR
jgi:diguanylate cyclase (GGDEF)-like protein